MFRYLDEQTWRFNRRLHDDEGRFKWAVSEVAGKRLTWRELIGEESTDNLKNEASDVNCRPSTEVAPHGADDAVPY